MALILYGSSHSRANRVLWMLEELGLPYEHRPIDFRDCAKDPAYLAINPMGTIPCIDDDGFVLAESFAINLYLAKKTGLLLEGTLAQEALATQWTLFSATSLEPEAVRWGLHTLWMPPEKAQKEVIAEALSLLQRPLNRLELALRHSDYLLGERFTVADLNIANTLWFMLKTFETSHPCVYSWLTRCLARPAYERASNKP